MNDRSGTGEQDVRQRLARTTRGVHEALHVHGVMGRLAAKGLTLDQYRSALTVLASSFAAIENRRADLAVWADFGLAIELQALENDVGCVAAPVAGDWLSDDLAVLGALYVAHGSGFGRQVLAKSVRLSLDEAPRAYMELPADPKRWRSLLAALEHPRPCSEVDAIERGAVAAFDLVSRLADAQLLDLQVGA
ncbi:MAG: biliverdin-producing heme oxygenase [Pseudomonadota bacterium]